MELSLTEINNFAFFTLRFRQAAKKSIFKRCLKLDKDIFHFDEKFLPLFRLSCGFCSPFLQQRSLARVVVAHMLLFYSCSLSGVKSFPLHLELNIQRLRAVVNMTHTHTRSHTRTHSMQSHTNTHMLAQTHPCTHTHSYT